VVVLRSGEQELHISPVGYRARAIATPRNDSIKVTSESIGEVETALTEHQSTATGFFITVHHICVDIDSLNRLASPECRLSTQTAPLVRGRCVERASLPSLGVNQSIVCFI
jgi:hypothetical protein